MQMGSSEERWMSEIKGRAPRGVYISKWNRSDSQFNCHYLGYVHAEIWLTTSLCGCNFRTAYTKPESRSARFAISYT